MRPKDSRGSLPEYFPDFLFDSVAEGYCQSGWIKWGELNCTRFLSRFSTKRGPIISCGGVLGFIRLSSSTSSFAVLDEEKKLGCLYHIAVSWSVERIGGWGISCVLAVLQNWFFTGPQWAHGWMEEACLRCDWYQTGPPEPSRCFPPSPQTWPANHAERTPAEQPREQWGASKPAICIYTRMQHTNTHARDFHKCGGGRLADKEPGKGA